MFRTAFAGFSVAALAAMSGLPSFAQLASQYSTFTATVPPICTVSDTVQGTTPMTLNGGGTELTGITDDFNFVSNGAVSVQLRSVSVIDQPTGTSGYSFTGSLNDSGAPINWANATSADPPVAYASGLAGDEDLSMGLTISDSGSMLLPGTYTSILTTDCIAS